MRIAIPMDGDVLARHLGHCEKFALIDVDPASRQVTASTEVKAPEHQPGLLPPWLKERGVTLVIAGNMGARASALFQHGAVEVLTGAPDGTPAALVSQYLNGTLITGASTCDH